MESYKHMRNEVSNEPSLEQGNTIINQEVEESCKVKEEDVNFVKQEPSLEPTETISVKSKPNDVKSDDSHGDSEIKGELFNELPSVKKTCNEEVQNCEKPVIRNFSIKSKLQLIKDISFDERSLNETKKPSGLNNCFVCNVCNKQFTRKSYLDSHLRTHYGEKPYVCTVCSKSFSWKGDLVKHERLHSGDRPFTCDNCEKNFLRKDHLVTHLRIHANSKQFVCSVCQKLFLRKDHLVCHYRVHTGEKPFTCEVCEKTFAFKCHLKRHFKNHHANLMIDNSNETVQDNIVQHIKIEQV